MSHSVCVCVCVNAQQEWTTKEIWFWLVGRESATEDTEGEQRKRLCAPEPPWVDWLGGSRKPRVSLKCGDKRASRTLIRSNPRVAWNQAERGPKHFVLWKSSFHSNCRGLETCCYGWLLCRGCSVPVHCFFFPLCSQHKFRSLPWVTSLSGKWMRLSW